VIIVDDKIQNEVKNLVSYSSVSILSLNLDETGSLIEQIKKYPKKFQSIKRNKNDLAAILYTSGTTGKSKGAMLSHRNLVSNSEVLRNFWKFTENDVLLHMLPIYHTHGLFVACNLLAIVGGSMIFLEKFDAEKALLWMKRATSMMGVPTFYTRLLANEKLNNESAKHMRLFISGSAPLLSETHIEFEKRTGKKILERYGMTETNMNISNPYDGLRKAGTVGIPLPGIEIRIVNEEGKEVEEDQIGTIELKGENIFKGYWGMEEKSKESFKDDGFFITGDLAKKDENGYFTIVGRDKDMIISGGLNVYPKEIEDVINELPNITESAVFGVQHDDFGEAVVAAVVTTDDKNDGSQILDYTKDKIAKYKQPKKIIFMSNLPRNSMGKVQKNKLRENNKSLFKS
jgi:malonyl-CoA/methylmalonyl-CoA synthetase